jgi:glycosyltransferase involved in cell wall biosynthesis
MPRKRVAIVSSYKVTCGIAYNAARIEQHLKPYYDVEVLPVDMELTKNPYSKNVRRATTRHLNEIAERIKEFDYVNIQLEAGVYGIFYIQALPRICKLLEAVRGHVILDMHCRPFPKEVGKKEILHSIKKYLIFAPVFLGYCLWEHSQCRRFWDLSRQMAQRNQLTMVAYNKIEKFYISNYQNVARVADHPPCYFSEGERETIRNDRPDYWRTLFGLQPADIMIGVFGFIASYKGFVDVIRALIYLPDPYKFVIFGGTNLNGIKQKKECEPYLNSMIQLVKALKLEARVIFSGTLTDDEICQATAQTDIVVLPYSETEQVASGPATMAIELADKIIATDTYTFKRYIEYYTGRIHK